MTYTHLSLTNQSKNKLKCAARQRMQAQGRRLEVRDIPQRAEHMFCNGRFRFDSRHCWE